MATAEVKLKKTEFTNEPFVDFSKPENRAAMEAALKKVAGEFGRDYPMFIGGEKVTTAEKIKSTNPSHPSQVIGVVQSASRRTHTLIPGKKCRRNNARKCCFERRTLFGSGNSRRRR